MSSLREKIVKATALGLVLTVTHVCLSAGLVRAASSEPLGKIASGQTAPQGRLTTRGNNPVTVNGNSAKTGETIFTGQSIQTPDGVGATVNLPGLGRVDLAPNTNLTLSFGDGKINVTLVSGCIILTANPGVAGTVEAGGSSQQTDTAKGGTIDTCTSRTPGAPPIVGSGAAAAAGAGAAGGATAAAATAGGLFGLGTAGTIGFITAASVITAAAITGSDTTSSSNRPNPSPFR
jgi:hypothetical protein